MYDIYWVQMILMIYITILIYNIAEIGAGQ